jgi:hypothetical protein
MEVTEIDRRGVLLGAIGLLVGMGDCSTFAARSGGSTTTARASAASRPTSARSVVEWLRPPAWTRGRGRPASFVTASSQLRVVALEHRDEHRGHPTPGRSRQQPLFVAKIVDVVGLYHDPPEKAVVLCTDEKSQCQALDRSQPVLPMVPGIAERRTHD